MVSMMVVKQNPHRQRNPARVPMSEVSCSFLQDHDAFSREPTPCKEHREPFSVPATACLVVPRRPFECSTGTSRTQS